MDFCHAPNEKSILLRHDVDLLPQNALAMAKLEYGMGVVATYYFRAVPESWDKGVIREIAGMGNEVGYHYESLTAALKKVRSFRGRRSEDRGRKTRGMERRLETKMNSRKAAKAQREKLKDGRGFIRRLILLRR